MDSIACFTCRALFWCFGGKGRDYKQPGRIQTIRESQHERCRIKLGPERVLFRAVLKLYLAPDAIHGEGMPRKYSRNLPRVPVHEKACFSFTW